MVAPWLTWLLAILQDASDGIMLGLGDPETVFRFDCCLTLDIFTTESFVRRKPCGGILVAFGAVCGAVDCHEVQWVVRELFALVRGQLLGTLLPCVAERDEMVDLDVRAGVLAADEFDSGAGVPIRQSAGDYDAIVCAGLECFFGQVACQDVVAGVAAVVVSIGPSGSELIAGIASLRGSALDRDDLELGESLGCVSGRATAQRPAGRVTWRRSDAPYGMSGSVTAGKRANQQEGGSGCQGWGNRADDLNGPSVRRGVVPR